jgi:hypothetical protein
MRNYSREYGRKRRAEARADVAKAAAGALLKAIERIRRVAAGRSVTLEEALGVLEAVEQITQAKRRGRPVRLFTSSY